MPILQDDRVAERTEQLSVATEEAKAASKAKSRFLASMSHEIRTPMNAILGFSQLMVRDSRLLPDHREKVQTILRSGDHLLGFQVGQENGTQGQQCYK